MTCAEHAEPTKARTIRVPAGSNGAVQTIRTEGSALTIYANVPLAWVGARVLVFAVAGSSRALLATLPLLAAGSQQLPSLIGATAIGGADMAEIHVRSAPAAPADELVLQAQSWDPLSNLLTARFACLAQKLDRIIALLEKGAP